MGQNDKRQSKNFLRGLVLFSQIGISMAFCVLLGVLVGGFLDRRLETSPWLLMIFSIIGVAASFKVLYDFTKKK